MAVDDYLDGHVAVAVATTAAILSPRVRKVLRRGVVYGVTGVLMAGDALAGAARDVKDATAASGTSDSPQAGTVVEPLDQPAAGGS